MNKIRELKIEINRLKKAGELGVTQINKIDIDDVGIRVFIEDTCYGLALEALTKLVNKHKLLMYITTEDTRSNEFVIRIH